MFWKLYRKRNLLFNVTFQFYLFYICTIEIYFEEQIILHVHKRNVTAEKKRMIILWMKGKIYLFEMTVDSTEVAYNEIGEKYMPNKPEKKDEENENVNKTNRRKTWEKKLAQKWNYRIEDTKIIVSLQREM